MLPDEKQLIRDFNRNIEWLKKNHSIIKKQTWIKAGEVMKLTNWDRDRLRRARERGEVEVKKEGGIFYLYESIPQIFLKNQTA